MDTSLFVACLNLLFFPPLIMLPFLKTSMSNSLTLRIGVILLGCGLAGQSFAVFYGLDQLHGWGTLWALKDVGAAFISIGIVLSTLNKEGIWR